MAENKTLWNWENQQTYHAKITELLDSASIKIKEMYLSEYELLSEEEKNSDIIYFIINKNYIMYRNIVYGEDKNDYNVINNAPIYLNSESAVEVNSNYKTFFDTLGEKNYTLLENKPQINNVELGGNKSSADLGLASTGDIETIQTELDTNIGYSLGLSVDPLTYVMTVDLKNSTGEVISTQNVDLPIESMIISASYANKKLTLNLQSGETLDVDISDIIAGLVNEDFTIAGINMKDNITATELKTALDIDDIESDIANLKATDETTSTEIASIKNNVAINRTTLGTSCKNLFDFANSKHMSSPTDAITYTKTDSSITISSHNIWASATYSLPKLQVGVKYTLSASISDLNITSETAKIRLSYEVAGTSLVAQTSINADGDIQISFTPENEVVYLLFYPNFSSSVYENTFTASDIMLRYADITDDTYEPYQPSLQEQVTKNNSDIAIHKTTLGAECKNLLKNTATTITRAGITYTVNADGSVSLSGKSTATGTYNYFSIPFTFTPGKYKVSGMPENSALNTYRVDIRENENGGTVYGHGTTEFEVEFKETTIAYYMIYIYASYTESLDGVVFYPMIRYADITDDTYEPYQPSLQEQVTALTERIVALESALTTATTQEA